MTACGSGPWSTISGDREIGSPIGACAETTETILMVGAAVRVVKFGAGCDRIINVIRGWDSHKGLMIREEEGEYSSLYKRNG